MTLEKLQKKIRKEFCEKFENNDYYLLSREVSTSGDYESIGNEVEAFVSEKIAEVWREAKNSIIDDINNIIDDHSDNDFRTYDADAIAEDILEYVSQYTYETH